MPGFPPLTGSSISQRAQVTRTWDAGTAGEPMKALSANTRVSEERAGDNAEGANCRPTVKAGPRTRARLTGGLMEFHLVQKDICDRCEDWRRAGESPWRKLRVMWVQQWGLIRGAARAGAKTDTAWVACIPYRKAWVSSQLCFLLLGILEAAETVLVVRSRRSTSPSPDVVGI